MQILSVYQLKESPPLQLCAIVKVIVKMQDVDVFKLVDRVVMSAPVKYPNMVPVKTLFIHHFLRKY